MEAINFLASFINQYPVEQLTLAIGFVIFGITIVYIQFK